MSTSILEFLQKLQTSKPILAIDYGEKKVGVAISNSSHTMALPLCVINTQKTPLIAELEKISRAKNTYGVIIGLPLELDSSENSICTKIRKLANVISERLDQPIFLQDERLTSKAADSLLKISGMKRKERNQSDDSIAACLILETVLNNLGNKNSL